MRHLLTRSNSIRRARAAPAGSSSRAVAGGAAASLPDTPVVVPLGAAAAPAPETPELRRGRINRPALHSRTRSAIVRKTALNSAKSVHVLCPRLVGRACLQLVVPCNARQRYGRQ